MEAYFRTGTELPCDLTFLIEGEATNALVSGFRAAIERGHRGDGREEETWVA